ncbi:MAG: ABC transporter ATP-binding protein [Tissierellia bacterium]|nr:ABC transporter ATP-binding protein [Tissierellia bacterium]
MININEITKVFGSGESEVRALRNINLSISPGEFVSIMGPSGCGKTTLLNILGLMDRPTSGKYLLNGLDTESFNDEKKAKTRAELLSFIFQSFALMEGYNVYDNVVLPLFRNKLKAEEKRLRVVEALDKVGLAGMEKKNVNLLSGGQKQRVAIARALVTDAQLILADEPTGALDSENSMVLMDQIIELNEMGKTIVVITHDERIASYAKRILKMVDGRIIQDLKTDRGDDK